MDLYAILGIGPGATLPEIKRAYRRLARRFHPDINPGDRTAELRFREILVAYETLVDPDRRHRYDETGTAGGGEPPVVSAFGFEGFDFSADSGTGEPASTFGELFADVFRRDTARAVSPAGVRGSDLHARLALTFDEAMAGGVHALPVTRAEVCRICGGRGLLRAVESVCLSCAGAGAVRSVRGHMVFSRPCADCGGAGRQAACDCRTCGGEGVEVRSELVAVRVPPGIADGARLRVPGKGHAGRRGGQAGDLDVAVEVAPHPVFRRHGDDLHVVVPVAIHEAALGARIEVPTLEGAARLRVPPGTQSGQRFRLRGRGVPLGDESVRGDLVVEVQLALPPVVDERAKALLREFGRLQTEDVRAPLFRAAGRAGAAPMGGRPFETS